MKFSTTAVFAVLVAASEHSSATLRGDTSEHKNDNRKLQACDLGVNGISWTGECSYTMVYDSVVVAGPCADDASFFALLGVDNTLPADDQVAAAKEKVASMCDSANDVSLQQFVPFSAITKRGRMFDREFMNGGTVLNQEYKTDTGENDLQIETERLQDVASIVASKRGITWPGDYLHNFNLTGSCGYNSAMCCWIGDRDGPNGDCSGDDCFGLKPSADHDTDVCYVDIKDSPKAAHVRNGLALFPENAEGNTHCAGFAWSDDPNDLNNKYKGNTLFNVAFQHGLIDNGYVRNVPGAPLCGCLEQMPTVSHSDCTTLEVTETFKIWTDINDKLYLKVDSANISFVDCVDDTGVKTNLATHYELEYSENAAEVKKRVGTSCESSEQTFLAKEGYKKSDVLWTKVAGKGRLYHESPSTAEATDPEYRAYFEQLWAASPNKILRRRCMDCRDSHRDVYYRRFDANGVIPENVDLLHVVKSYWHEFEGNMWGQQFELYSTYDDALKMQNPWQACNFNDANVGFPRDCGPQFRIGGQWNSFTAPVHGRHWGQGNVAFYVETIPEAAAAS